MKNNLSNNRFFLATLCMIGCAAVSSATTVSVGLGGVACSVPNSGLCTTKTGATTVTFDGLDGTSLPYVGGGIATYSAPSGAGSPFVTGSASGQWATPAGDSTTYLTTGSPSRPSVITISLSDPISYFGMYLGSPDQYNRIEFYSANVLVQGYQGNNLINPSDGAWSRGEYVNFDFADGTIDKIVLSSSSAAMETDNHAFVAAVPEPMSMGLIAIGLLGVASLSRRFRK